MDDDDWSSLPLMLTVEEAGRVLRIGRTLAYAQATLYFATAGAEGLPVLRIGGVLRVPRAALRELVTTGQLVQLTPVPATPQHSSTSRRTATGDRTQLSLLPKD